MPLKRIMEMVGLGPLDSKSSLKLNKKFLISKLTLCLVLCSTILTPTYAAKSKSTEKRVVCYYTNWSAYRQGPAKFLPDNINPYLCTHLVYAFGGLTSDSGIKPFDKYQDIDKGGYTKFNGLKTYNKALKTLIAIGGWNEGSQRFSNLVADAETRKTFIKHSIRFLRQYQFDGLDLDWEYPASRDGGVPEDKKNYAQFIKELREAFEEESKSGGRARLLLTVAVPAGIEWIQKGFDIPTINRNIDFFNLLTYDYHASTEPNANHHAPLKARDGISEYDWKGQLNIEYSINYYLKEGADPDKLVVGLPTYGRSYNLFNVDSYDIDAPSSGPGTKGKYTKEPGYLAYYEICEGVKSGEWRVENEDSLTQGPHAVKNDQWVGYDDTRMMAIKAKWVKDNGLGGIMFWSVDNDDFRGICHGKPFPLIEAAKLAYLTGEASTATNRTTNKRPSLNRFSSSNNRRITTPTPPKTTTGAPTAKRRNKNRRNKNKKNKVTNSTTPAPSTTSNPLSTPEPPTTPDPGVDFECKDDGFFPHPRECKKYFWCLDAPGLGLVAHHFTCPAGLYFNKNTDSCDYARNVACKDKSAAAKAAVATTTTTTTQAPKTTQRTTTTTTTEAPEDEEYEDEEEEEEEDEPEVKTQTKSKSDADNGRSVKEINDIKDLLKLIRKLGGVEELEKYLDENPGVAAAIEEYDDEEEEEIKPKTSTTSSSLFNRNRFSPTTSTNTKKFQQVASPSLKYTSIQRSRPSTTTNSPDSEEDEEDEEDSVPPPKKKFSSTTSSNRPKYVTLSRKSDLKSTEKSTTSTSTTPKATSSTETSVVIRFSRDDEKLFDEITNSSKSSNETDQDSTDNDRYVQLSRTKSSTKSTTPKTTEKPVTKKEDESEEEESEEYSDEEPDDSVVEHVTTLTPSTTTTPSPPPLTAKPRLRIPTRKATSFSTRSRGTTSTTTSTTSKPFSSSTITYPPGEDDAGSRKARNFSTGNRRNLFQTRNKSTTESITDAASSQTANEESIIDLLTTSPDISRRVSTSSNEIQTEKPVNKPRSRSISSSSSFKSTTPSTRADINNISRSRSRSRFRSSTEQTPKDLSTTSATPIYFRRRVKAKSTSTTTTTKRPTTTTPPPKKEDEEEAEYYYYYYDEDDEEIPTSTSAPVKTFHKTLTQRSTTSGLRTETFTPSTSTVQLQHHQQLAKESKNDLRTFSKRNLELSPKNSKNNVTPPPPVQKHKWSDRAVVPLSEKIKLRQDGTVECLDKGIFPHPISCKQFVHCVDGEENNGSIRAWVYACPELLTFDPVGGMCNYDEFYSKKGNMDGNNACIE